MAASDVLVGSPATGTGGVLAGPLGTTLPTDATTALDAGLTPGGYIGEDGMTKTVNRTTDKIRAWGGDTVRVVQTEHDVTFAFSFLETTEFSTKAVYGDGNVTVASGLTSVKVNAELLPHRVWVFDMKDGAKRIRVVVPDGQITEVGETTFVHTNAISHQVTIEAFPDENGNKAYMYIEDDDSASSSV